MTERAAEVAWPDWLVELARLDDPPTDLEGASAMLGRFRGTGVRQFAPTDLPTRAVIAVERADEATAIAAAGPGFEFAEPLEAEPAPVKAALERLLEFLTRFDQLRRLRLAARDMELVAMAARALVDEDDANHWWVRQHRELLETGLVTTYARCYIHSSKAQVGRRWWPDGDDRALHDRLTGELRNEYHAHADRTSHRTLRDAWALLGMDRPSRFTPEWTRLPKETLEQIVDLAERQAARLDAAADEVGVELGEQPEL